MEGFSLPNYYAEICAVSIYSINVILHKSELFNQEYGLSPMEKNKQDRTSLCGKVSKLNFVSITDS